MKRKIKVWGKIKLYETSVVGIPAYPDAHASVDSFSLIKALSNASLKTGFVKEGEQVGDELNTKEEETETMEEKSQSVEITKEEVPEAEATEEAKAEPEAEATETEPEGEETEKKSDMSEIAKAIKEGIKDAMDEFKAERGGVETQVPKVKSLGEMAIGQGLFVNK